MLWAGQGEGVTGVKRVEGGSWGEGCDHSESWDVNVWDFKSSLPTEKDSSSWLPDTRSPPGHYCTWLTACSNHLEGLTKEVLLFLLLLSFFFFFEVALVNNIIYISGAQHYIHNSVFTTQSLIIIHQHTFDPFYPFHISPTLFPLR